MTAILDIIENTSIIQNKNGYTVTRIAIVESVSGNASTRIYNAINDAQLPNLGDAHPDISTITLNDISGEVIDNETVKVTMSYYNDPESATTQATAAVRATGSTALDETQTDVNGDRLYFKIAADVFGPGIAYESITYTAEVERPRLSIEFNYTGTAYPHSDIQAYLGRVNDNVWNGYPAKSMLCSAINVNERGDNFDISYTFVNNEKGWQFLAALNEKNLNLPASVHPTDPTDGVDLYDAGKKFDVYQTADFSALGFTLGIDYAEITGTAVVYPRISEADIVTGGKTVIITLYGGETWVASGATFDAQRANIIAGLVSNKSEAAGWDAELALSRIATVGNVVRTSDTVVTITLIADAAYQITEPETISVTIPSSALVASSTAMIPATSSFTIVGS